MKKTVIETLTAVGLASPPPMPKPRGRPPGGENKTNTIIVHANADNQDDSSDCPTTAGGRKGALGISKRDAEKTVSKEAKEATKTAVLAVAVTTAATETMSRAPPTTLTIDTNHTVVPPAGDNDDKEEEEDKDVKSKSRVKLSLVEQVKQHKAFKDKNKDKATATTVAIVVEPAPAVLTAGPPAPPSALKVASTVPERVLAPLGNVHLPKGSPLVCAVGVSLLGISGDGGDKASPALISGKLSPIADATAVVAAAPNSGDVVVKKRKLLSQSAMSDSSLPNSLLFGVGDLNFKFPKLKH